MPGPLRGVSWLPRRLRHERAGCSSGGEWLLPRKALPTALRSGWAAALSSRSVDIIAAGPSGVTSMQYTIMCALSAGDGFFSRWDGGCGAALGCCCAARTSVLQVTCWGARKTHAMISPFRPFFFFAFSSSADLPWSTLRLSRICRFPLYAPQQITWFRRSEWRTLNAVSETSLLTPLVGPLRSNFTC